MGFTLRATLDFLPPDAIVEVAELVPAVVDWNRGPLGPLARHPLDATPGTSSKIVMSTPTPTRRVATYVADSE